MRGTTARKQESNERDRQYTVSGQTGVMAIPFPLKLAAGTINRVYFYASSAVPE